MAEIYEYTKDNPPRQISTTISTKERELILENGYKYNDLIMIGYMVKQAGFDISVEELKKFKENGWTLNDLIRKGIHATENNHGILERLRDLEKEVAYLKKKG